MEKTSAAEVRSSTRKIRTIIVDDEPLARSNLSMLLRPDTEIDIIAQCASGVEALAVIRDMKPDLLFLDVQMPECDGFDVLELLGEDAPRAVVFVTAYDQYALKAFEAGALDYLLKPFDNARFERTLSRAKDRIALSGVKPQSDLASPLPQRVERFALKSAGRVLFVKVSEIDWVEAADYYVCLHVGPKSHLLRRSLTELDGALDPAVFCRIHRSAIVNLGKVRGLTLNQNGEQEVLLENGARLPLSRRYRKQLQSRLGMRNS